MSKTRWLRRVPVVSQVLSWIYVFFQKHKFESSAQYWENRYISGGLSGEGSYGRLAAYKAEYLNAFVKDQGVESVIEFGCGDGNQLQLSNYPSYTGFDVSPAAIKLCKNRFSGDRNKNFFLYKPDCFVDHAGLFRADLCISLDVLYHIVEDDIYADYLQHVFDAAKHYVILYTVDTDVPDKFQLPHVKRRNSSGYVLSNFPQWQLKARIPNKYPVTGLNKEESNADFLVFERRMESK